MVVVGAHLDNAEARGLERSEIALPWNRTGDARRPEFDVAPRALLERPGADDVGDREPSARPQDARRFGKDAVLDWRQVDHAVRDDGVEARRLEGKSVDGRVDELDLREPITIPQTPRLVELLVGEVDSDHAT